MVDVDDPGLGPGGSGGDQVWALVGEHGFEFAAHQLGQGHVRDEKSFAGRIPVAAVIGDSTAGDDELLGPGVEDGEHAYGAADEAAVVGKLYDGVGRSLHQ